MPNLEQAICLARLNIATATNHDFDPADVDIRIAAAVRSFMGSESQLAAASKAVAVTRFMREYSWVAREQIVDIIGACHDHEDARAALSAAIGEDIGGGRGSI